MWAKPEKLCSHNTFIFFSFQLGRWGTDRQIHIAVIVFCFCNKNNIQIAFFAMQLGK